MDRSVLAQSFYSRYCSESYVIPDPEKRERAFMNSLMTLVKSGKYDVLLPVGWHPNYYAAKAKAVLEQYTHVPIASRESMEVAANKDLTMAFAKKIGVDVPATQQPKNEGDVDEICRNAEFPLVIKGSTSAGHVHYARNSEELKAYYRTIPDPRPIIQEYVKGYGCGFFALYDHGKCVAAFMHKRIREYPVSGGPSVAARAYYSEELKRQGLKLLDSLKWHGVAMVEFKHDVESGRYRLMEVNPKFWGSLELAIEAGVDFPYLAYQLAKGEEFDPVFDYDRSARFRWPFPGELLYDLSQRRIRGFVGDFFDRHYADDVYLTDPVPLFSQMLGTIRSLQRKHAQG